MTKLLKTAAVAALITGFANSAFALSTTDALNIDGVTYETIEASDAL